MLTARVLADGGRVLDRVRAAGPAGNVCCFLLLRNLIDLVAVLVVLSTLGTDRFPSTKSFMLVLIDFIALVMRCPSSTAFFATVLMGMCTLGIDVVVVVCAGCSNVFGLCFTNCCVFFINFSISRVCCDASPPLLLMCLMQSARAPIILSACVMVGLVMRLWLNYIVSVRRSPYVDLIAQLCVL